MKSEKSKWGTFRLKNDPIKFWSSHYQILESHISFTSIMKPHKRLNAWIRSFELVKILYQVTNSFPAEERFGLVAQIRRAGVSVPVNIAEGAARKGKKEFIHFLHVSLGSLTELDTLLLLSRDLNFVDSDKANRIIDEMDAIGKMIFGLIKKLESEM